MTPWIFAIAYAAAALVAFVLIARSEGNTQTTDDLGAAMVSFGGALMWPLALAMWASLVAYRAVTR